MGKLAAVDKIVVVVCRIVVGKIAVVGVAVSEAVVAHRLVEPVVQMAVIAVIAVVAAAVSLTVPAATVVVVVELEKNLDYYLNLKLGFPSILVQFQWIRENMAVVDRRKQDQEELLEVEVEVSIDCKNRLVMVRTRKKN